HRVILPDAIVHSLLQRYSLRRHHVVVADDVVDFHDLILPRQQSDRPQIAQILSCLPGFLIPPYVKRSQLQKIDDEIGFITAGTVMELSVRPLATQDFDDFINYWVGLSPAEIERLGVAIDRLPTADRMRSDLETMLAAPDEGVRSFVLAWCVD